MLKKIIPAMFLPCIAAILLWGAAGPLQAAQATNAVALSGLVSSQEEGPMEGVLVSAQKAGSTITITVVSDGQGRYSFPRTKLEPGQFALTIRATGYQMDAAKAEVTARKSAQADLKLRKTDDLSAQLTNTEWLMSMPGPEQRKSPMLNCTSCHTLQRVVRSHHDATEFTQVMGRMANYASASSPEVPVRRVAARDANPERFRKQAEFLSAINLSKVAKWEYPLKTLPRPKGRATHAIVTEYALPRGNSEPHDVILDAQGIAWYSDFGQQFIGRLDPKTGKTTEYAVPELKPGSPRGGLEIEWDRTGNLWLAMMYQGGIAKFDRKTEKFQTYALPKEINSDEAQQAMVMPANYEVDGKVWLNNVGPRMIHRVDIASGKFETIRPYGEGGVGSDESDSSGGRRIYGIASDAQNNLYFMDFFENIGRVDAKTKEVKFYPVPTRNSVPRRGQFDAQGRLWFAEFFGNKIGVLDPQTEKIQEWAMPNPFSAPYDVTVDKNGEAWTGGMDSDRIARVNVKRGEITEYLLPRETNVRRVYVDNSTTPVTFWVGNNHGASIVKLEPLD